MIVEYDKIAAAASGYAAVPVWACLPIDAREPLELFSVLRRQSRHCFLFESREDPDTWGRYTFIGFDPVAELTVRDFMVRLKSGVTTETEYADASATQAAVTAAIAQLLASYHCPTLPELPQFTGGLVGYLAYDYIGLAEPNLQLGSVVDEEGFNTVDLMLFDKLVAFDHLEKRLLLIRTIATDALEENYHKAVFELEALADLVAHGVPIEHAPLELAGPIEPLFDEERFCAMVETAKQHIFEGDIFQVVLSNRLSAQANGSLFATYQALREINPSPYMFYFSSDDIELAGASPETLVKLEGGVATTYPLAGTRPRGATAEEDAELERGLLTDTKELAEHNMLVDLGRNDLGRVCEIGSVEVGEYLSVLRFSHVMHIGSTVSGRLACGRSALDLVGSVLPAGTLSGAPKFRACEIINELEGNRRGVYGGAVGYFGFNGSMDTCIAIRLAFKKNGRVFLRSGAGIVADSVPQAEYAEVNNKMAAVLQAVNSAQGVGADDGGAQ
jgi:anthranilate synthase component 1